MDLAADLETLSEQLDAAQEELFGRIASHGSDAALEGLLSAYPRLSTTFSRRAVLRVLHRFAGAATSDQAVAHLVDVARGTHSQVLRGEALDALEACGDSGADALVRMVDSTSTPAIREGAMERLVRAPRTADFPWYLETYLPSNEASVRRAVAAGERGAALPRLRELAFDVVAPGLGDLELVGACRDSNREIRRVALLELEKIGSARTEDIAEDFFEATDEFHGVRIVAAGVLRRLRGPRTAKQFVKYGLDHVTPLALRYALADLIEDAHDSAVEKQLLGALRRGEDFQKLFALRALRSAQSEKAVRGLIGAIADKSPTVAFYAILIAQERVDVGAEEVLRKVLRSARNPDLAAAALRALAGFPGDPKARRDELIRLARDTRLAVRSVAVRSLAQSGEREALPTLLEALEDSNWSVRLSALRGIEELREPGAVAQLVARLEHEEGRVLVELGEALWRLTGQPFGTRAESWRAWVARNSEGLGLLSEEQLEARVLEREEQRLRATSLDLGADVPEVVGDESSLFGMRIRSRRVLFVVDVSLTMELALREDYEGAMGKRRFDVARVELLRCLESLDPGTLFGIYAFSARLLKWKSKGLEPLSDSSLASARKFIDKLTMGSGTDLWLALEKAMELEDLDTIVILSDGEPHGGAVVDPVQLRLEFQRHNVGRNVKVQAIALGDDIELLKWLAQDSGGEYSRLR